MGNIEKKMEELCIATKNTKESQINKGELQLSMNETIKFIIEKFDEFEKDRHYWNYSLFKLLYKLLKICQKNIWNGPKDWQIREFSRLTRTIFQV